MFPCAVEGTLGPVEALLQQRWPYAVDLKGEIAGQKTALATAYHGGRRALRLDDLKVSVGANALTGKPSRCAPAAPARSSSST